MTEAPLVHVVDDDGDLREAVLETLEDAVIPAIGFSRASDALKVLDPEWPGVILSDIRMPGISGLEFLDQAKVSAPDVPFVLMTGHGDVATAIAAMKAGAYDFLEKPTPPEYLVGVVRRALQARTLQLENSSLRQMIVTGGSLKTRLAGRSKAMKICRRDILAIAPLNVDVLLRGETGTGKGLAAHCIHDMSPRKSKAFVTVNCATLSLENIEESLFSDQGKIAEAAGGTLFLDDLGALEESVQARIFRFLEDRGSAPETPRIVAALKEEPDVLIAAGKLRADLYYLINVAQVLLPPLRERDKDIFFLLEHFIREAAGRHNLKLPNIRAEDLAPFRTYDWPGNVRELRNAAEKMVIGLDVVLGSSGSSTRITAGGYDAALQKFEFDLLQTALMQAGGRKGDAAEILGIPRKRLYLRLKQYGLN